MSFPDLLRLCDALIDEVVNLIRIPLIPGGKRVGNVFILGLAFRAADAKAPDEVFCRADERLSGGRLCGHFFTLAPGHANPS